MSAQLTIIRLVTALIPIKRVRRRLRDRWMAAARARRLARMLPVVRARYAAHAASCREKLAAGKTLRVCFLVCDASMFSAEPVYQAMCRDSRFEPFIAVVPRVSRGETFLRETQEKTVGVLAARYPDVRCLYDPETKTAQPLEGQADVIFTSIVYDDQTLKSYTALSLSRFALVACISYGYSGMFKVNAKRTIFLPEIALMWRYYVSNMQTLRLWKELNPLLADTTALSGYAKMDRLAGIKPRPQRPKTIVLAPHHSLPNGTEGLTLSTFLTHADFFLELPTLYPEVHFVFRPHPLLFVRLASRDWWGPEKVAAYCHEMESLPNVEFQRGGDYFETFVNSDALIHDCGSFLAEYFYTGHPQCYLLSSEETVDREFLPFGKRLVEHVYRAFSAADIRQFVEKVVIGGDDPGKSERESLAQEEVCINYPHAAERVICDMLECIKGDRCHD